MGSYLLDKLRSRGGSELRLFWRNPNQSAPDGVEVVHGDLNSYGDCQQFARDLEVIYYLAHHNSPVNSDFDQANDATLNLVPLLIFLKAVEHRRTRPRIVYFSSGGAVYGSPLHRIPFREDQECRPACSYGVQKLAAEHYLRIAAEKQIVTAAILRIGNAFGSLLPRHRMQGLIGVAVNNVLHGLPVRIFGNLENVRDYVHLSDICNMAFRVAETREHFTVVNVGRGEGLSVRQVLGIVEACCDVPLRLETDPDAGKDLMPWAVLDIAKAREQYCWEPSITLESGISEMVERWRQVNSRDLRVTAGGQR